MTIWTEVVTIANTSTTLRGCFDAVEAHIAATRGKLLRATLLAITKQRVEFLVVVRRESKL